MALFKVTKNRWKLLINSSLSKLSNSKTSSPMTESEENLNEIFSMNIMFRNENSSKKNLVYI